MNTAVYVVLYHTESGDRGVVGYFLKEPTDGHLTAYFRALMPDEFVKEGRQTRRYVFWEVQRLTLEALPKAVSPIQSI